MLERQSLRAAAIERSVSREYLIRRGFMLCSRPLRVPYVGGGGSAVRDISTSINRYKSYKNKKLISLYAENSLHNFGK